MIDPFSPTTAMVVFSGHHRIHPGADRDVGNREQAAGTTARPPERPRGRALLARLVPATRAARSGRRVSERPRTEAGRGQYPAQISAAVDPELRIRLAQMPFDSARAEEQLSTDLRVRPTISGQPGDLRLLRGQLHGRLGTALTHTLPGGQQLVAGPFGEPLGSHVGEHLVGGAQLCAGVRAAAAAA